MLVSSFLSRSRFASLWELSRFPVPSAYFRIYEDRELRLPLAAAARLLQQVMEHRDLSTGRSSRDLLSLDRSTAARAVQSHHLRKLPVMMGD